MKEQRKLQEVPYPDYAEKKTVANDDNNLPDTILSIWPKEDGWVLGHAMNGLLWGKIQNSGLVLAYDADAAWGAALKASTLLDLRIFNENRELRVWRTDDGLKTCMISENSDKTGCRAWDEDQIFIAGKRIGDAKQVSGVPFSLVEGPAGQQQAIPVDWDGEKQAYRLRVRHYAFPQEETGMLHVRESRLLTISKSGR